MVLGGGELRERVKFASTLQLFIWLTLNKG